ncbi:DUF4126 family protein [Phenylobacterium sp.]|uniref:DUF4126 family protein n=1 Tax=Phenylobacterium sp. TaxID=1871053 RepID=UPI002ED89CC4
MTVYLAALLLGVIAGLRALTPVAAVCWAAFLGLLKLTGTPLAVLGSVIAVGIATAAAVFEFVSDKLPKTPSRKVPVQFGARLLMGGLAGAAIGASAGVLPIGAGLGIVGAVAGTYGGAAGRGALARAFGRDLPAALLEDLVAVAGAAAIVCFLL